MDPDTSLRLLGHLKGTSSWSTSRGERCPACKEEVPRFVAAQRDFGDRVQFLFFCEDGSPDLADTGPIAENILRRHPKAIAEERSASRARPRLW